MCVRYSLLLEKKAIIDRFNVEEAEIEVTPRYNMSPSIQLPVVVNYKVTKLVGMRWGLVPFWAKDPKIGERMVNARSETIADKPSFRTPFQKRRCLIPATGFYEWQKRGSSKVPMHIQLKSKDPFGIAGIYDLWKTPTDKMLMSCALITTEPNQLLKPIHNRMPVILEKPAEKDWLDPEFKDYSRLQDMMKPYKSDLLEAYEISTYVNNPANEGPQCTRPVKQKQMKLEF